MAHAGGRPPTINERREFFMKQYGYKGNNFNKYKKFSEKFLDQLEHCKSKQAQQLLVCGIKAAR